MQACTRVTGPAAPLRRPNIDTDVIIRIERLTSLPRDQLGPYAFEALRYREDGSEDPEFVLQLPAFRNAPILLAGINFGCGSSREGAVWALMAAGLHCVIAESFGDIFYNNCFQNGLLPVVLTSEQLDRLSHTSANGQHVTVDLVERRVIAPDGTEFGFAIDAQRREALLEGLDDISRTMKRLDEIAEWQSCDRSERPWIWSYAE